MTPVPLHTKAFVACKASLTTFQPTTRKETFSASQASSIAASWRNAALAASAETHNDEASEESESAMTTPAADPYYFSAIPGAEQAVTKAEMVDDSSATATCFVMFGMFACHPRHASLHLATCPL